MASNIVETILIMDVTLTYGLDIYLNKNVDHI